MLSFSFCIFRSDYIYKIGLSQLEFCKLTSFVDEPVFVCKTEEGPGVVAHLYTAHQVN